jgi:hypothetical protein
VTAYQLRMISYLNYEVMWEGNRIGTIAMDGELGDPMFTYRSGDGTVKGSVPEIKDAVRALKSWHELKRV